MSDWSSFNLLKGRSITRVSIDPRHSFSECWFLLLHTSDGGCFEVCAESTVTWGWDEANSLSLRPAEPVAGLQSADIRLHDIRAIRVFLRATETGDIVQGLEFRNHDANALAVFAGVMPNAMTVISTELSTRYYADCDVFALRSFLIDPDPEPEVNAEELRQRFASMPALLPHLKAKTRSSTAPLGHGHGPHLALPLYAHQRAGHRSAPIAPPESTHSNHLNQAEHLVHMETAPALAVHVVRTPQGSFVYRYDDEAPVSLSFHRLENGVLLWSMSHDQQGGSEERYRYDAHGLLRSIRVRRFWHDRPDDASTHTEHFTHDAAGVLRQIERQDERGERKLIYTA